MEIEMTMSLPRSTTLVVALIATAFIVGCGTSGTIGTTGNAAAMAGEATFSSTCASCHSASSLAGSRALITNNLGTLNSAMSGITLTDTEVSNLMAYLATQ